MRQVRAPKLVELVRFKPYNYVMGMKLSLYADYVDGL